MNRPFRTATAALLIGLLCGTAVSAQEKSPPIASTPSTPGASRRVDQQTLLLNFNQDQTPTSAPPKRKGGGGIVGAIDNVTDKIRADDPEAKKRELRTATNEVKVEAYVTENAGKPWIVSLKVKTSGSQIHPGIPAATRRELERENALLLNNLGKWTHTLSEVEMRAVQETGELLLPVAEPLNALKKWSKPTLTLRVPREGEAAPVAETVAAGSTDPTTGITTTSVAQPDGSHVITKTDPDGNVVSMEMVPKAGASTTIASATDPATGITTTSMSNPDGSRVISKTDAEGNVLSTELIPPKGSRTSIASSTDPKTGITTTAESRPDGTRRVTTSKTHKDADGTVHITSTDDQGNRSETVASKDGNTTVIETTPRGEKITTHQAPDGAIDITEDHPGGSRTTIRREPDGSIVTEKFDHHGNKQQTITHKEGQEVREDALGNVTTVTSAEGKTTEVTADRRGNTTTITRDAAGEVVAREENRVTPKAPGQQYFETALKGTDWEALPPSLKSRYAGSESQMRGNEEMQKLRDAQEAEGKRVAEESRKFSEDLQVKTDAKLATIQDEQKEADRKSAERVARDNARLAQVEREKKIKESYDTAAKLESEYAAAVERGDKAEAQRIIQKQDAHHDASAQLLELNEEENQAMLRKQAIRDRLNAKVNAASSAAAEERVAEAYGQDVKESVTSLTKHVSLGSAMQQETKGSTRQANRQAAYGEEKTERFERLLRDPKTTLEERVVIGEMLGMSELQMTGAYDQLASNAQLTAAGYAIDAAMLAGGPISKGIGMAGAKVMGTTVGTAVGKGVVAGGRAAATLAKTTWVGKKAAGAASTTAGWLPRGLGDLAASGTLAVAERVAGKQAAALLRTSATAVADVARSAATRVGDTAVAKVLRRDIATGAQAESRWLTAVVEESAKGMAISTGVQVATTGTVDMESVVLGGIGGGLIGGTMSASVRANPSLPGARTAPAPVRPPAEVPSVSSPVASPRPDVPSPVSAPKPDRLVAANTPPPPSPLPMKPAVETPIPAPTTAPVDAVPAPPQPTTPVADLPNPNTTPAPPKPRELPPSVAATRRDVPAPVPATKPEPVVVANTPPQPAPRPMKPVAETPATTPAPVEATPAPPQPRTSVADSTPPVTTRPSEAVTKPVPPVRTPAPTNAPEVRNTPVSETSTTTSPRKPSTAPVERLSPVAESMPPRENVTPKPPRTGPGDTEPGVPLHTVEKPGPRAVDAPANPARQPSDTPTLTANQPRPKIVYPGDPDYAPAAQASPRPGPRPNNVAPPNNKPPIVASNSPRRFEPDAPTEIALPPRKPGPPRSPAETKADVRESVPSAAQKEYDKVMETVDRLIEADPRFADVNYKGVAEQARLRAGQMKAEEAAALALNYQGHKGARVTPEALSSSTGITPAEAAAAVRSGWDKVNVDPVDIHNPGPKRSPAPAENTPLPPDAPQPPDAPPPTDAPQPEAPMIEEFNLNDVEEFDPTVDYETPAQPQKPVKPQKFPPRIVGQKPNVDDVVVPRAEQEAMLQGWDRRQGGRNQRRKVNEAERQQMLNEAVEHGQFKDAPSAPEGIIAPPMRNAHDGSRPHRKLIPGDAEYLENIMHRRSSGARDASGQLVDHGVPIVLTAPAEALPMVNGKPATEILPIGPVRPNQNHVAAHVVNDYVERILKSPPGGFPRSGSRPEEKIGIFTDGTVRAGHHRFVAAVMASQLTGRPLYGAPNAIIPANAIEFLIPTTPSATSAPPVLPNAAGAAGQRPHSLTLMSKEHWRIGVAPPFPEARAVKLQTLQENLANLRDLETTARRNGSAEADRLSSQVKHVEWELQTLEVNPE